MAERELTLEEKYRLDIITKVINKELQPGHAGKLLGVSPRQIRRLKEAVKQQGEAAVVHKLKGKQGNHHIEVTIKEKALSAIRSTYSDFTPKFANEKLEEHQQIQVTSQTIRIWMTEANLWKPRKQKKINYRSWRPRKEYFGELQQFDGSYHLWFENRFVDSERNPLEVCLLAAIDDATGKITKAQFMDNEGVVAVCTFWKEYVREIGKPLHIYLDKFSTYKINHKAAVDNTELITQFQRIMQTLGVNLITAHSPQAKGRIERLFQTLQDRLIKEMRLSRVNTPEEGNRFLTDVFLPKWNNSEFVVMATIEGDVHKPLLAEEKKKIKHIFSIQETRRINLDFTIQFKNNWYQLTEIQPTTVRALERVTMETWLDGSVHIVLKEYGLTYLLLPEKPKKQRIKQPAILTTHPLNYKPPPNHPWRRYPKK